MVGDQISSQWNRIELAFFLKSNGFDPNRVTDVKLWPEGWAVEVIVSNSDGRPMTIDNDFLKATVAGTWVDTDA